MHKKIYYISRVLLVLYLTGLCFLCFWNFKDGLDVQTDFWGIPTDKIAHFLLFIPFPLICQMAFRKLRDTPLKLMRFSITVFWIGALLGGAIELIQGESGFRSCDFMDFVADCAGLATSISLILVYEAFFRNWRKRIC